MMKLLKKHGLYDKVGVYKTTSTDPIKWSRLTLDLNDHLVLVPCLD
jgi:hypothetical protein